MSGEVLRFARGIRIPAAIAVAFSLFKDRANFFQSFCQPILLLTVLTFSLRHLFPEVSNTSVPPAGLRAFYMSFSAADYYGVVMLLITILVASQYGTYLANQVSASIGGYQQGLHYRTAPPGSGAILAGGVILVTASVIFFLVSSGIFLGVSWPWTSLAFWILLAGLILLSVSLGFGLGLITGRPGRADLMLTVIVFGSALAAGAFYPYPDGSPVWNIAPFNPVTPLLVRVLEIIRAPTTPPAPPELIVAIIASLTMTGALAALSRIPPSRAAGSAALPGNTWIARVIAVAGRNQASIFTAVAIMILPPAISVATAPDFELTRVPLSEVGIAVRATTEVILYPYASLQTVLLAIFAMATIAPLVACPPLLRRSGLFQRRELTKLFGMGSALIVISTFIVGALWDVSSSQLVYSAVALTLFFGWATGVMLVIAEASRTSTVYWAVAVSITILVVFLGGSLWNPSNLGTAGAIASLILPNGLLLARPSGGALIIVAGQIGLLAVVLHRMITPRRIRRVGTRSSQGARRDAMGAQDTLQNSLIESLILRERTEILQEVHDTLGHGITGALWQIRSAQGMTNDPDLRSALDRAARGLEDGLERVRTYVRDSVPRRNPDWHQIQATIDAFTHCPIDLSVDGVTHEYNPQVVARFTRTIGELLTNAARYGSPRKISIHLSRTSQSYRLRYREHGVGWGARGPHMGYGLSTLHTLFSELGGSFHLDDAPDAPGIQVIGMIPTTGIGRIDEREA